MSRKPLNEGVDKNRVDLTFNKKTFKQQCVLSDRQCRYMSLFIVFCTDVFELHLYIYMYVYMFEVNSVLNIY